MGIREFVVGTGGTAAPLLPRDQAEQPGPKEGHGVLKLYLANSSYSWRFVSVDGRYSDNGSYRCTVAPEEWCQRALPIARRESGLAEGV